MRFANAAMFLVTAAVLVSISAAQSPKLIGTASERSGTPLNGVVITVKDSKGTRQTVTNTKGYYESTADLGDVLVECRAVADSDSVVYATNPVKEQLKITPNSNPARQDCIFDPVTTAEAYWKLVAQRIGDKAAQSGNLNIVVLNNEWLKIDTSGLDPSSKAAAAHQFFLMDWSAKIDNAKFKEYGKVDVSTLKKAMSGDNDAFDKLPPSVGKDVVLYKNPANKMIFMEHP